MHPALTVDPAEQGTRVGQGRVADGKQGCQAKLPEAVTGKRPAPWID
jgi:hypothetical protein